MTSDTSATDFTSSEEGGAQQPRYITEQDFRAFQAAKDREVAEERALADEAFGRLREIEARLEAAEARGIEDDDPRVVELNKQLRAAQKEARDAKGLVQRFSGAYKANIVALEALRLARGDEAKAGEYAKALAVGRTEQEVKALAQQLRTTGTTPPPPPAGASREEVDTGRGSGRAGAPRVTREWIDQGMRADPRFYSKHRDVIEAAAQRGPIPDR